MLLMMAWLFWYFYVAEEKRRRDLQLIGDEDLINNNNDELNNENTLPLVQHVNFEGQYILTSNGQLEVEENIVTFSEDQEADELKQKDNKKRRVLVDENIDASFVNITKSENGNFLFEKSSVTPSQSISNVESLSKSSGKRKKKLLVAENIDASLSNTAKPKDGGTLSNEKVQRNLVDERVDASFIQLSEKDVENESIFDGNDSGSTKSKPNLQKEKAKDKLLKSNKKSNPKDDSTLSNEKVQRNLVDESVDASFIQLSEKDAENKSIFDGNNSGSTKSKPSLQKEKAKDKSLKSNKKSNKKNVAENVETGNLSKNEKNDELSFDVQNKTSTNHKQHSGKENTNTRSVKSNKKSKRELVDEDISASTVILTESGNDNFSFDNNLSESSFYPNKTNEDVRRKVVSEVVETSSISFTESGKFDGVLSSDHNASPGLNSRMNDKILESSTVSLASDALLNYVNNKENDEFDYEISSAFTTANDDDIMRASLMKNRMSSLEPYKGKSDIVASTSSTRINITSSSSINQNKEFEPGHIHSIVIPQEEHHYSINVPKCDENHTHSMTLPKDEKSDHGRVRSVSPSVCMHPENPVHMTHKGYEGSSASNNQHSQEDIHLSNAESAQFSPNNDLIDELSSTASSSKQNDEKILPGKLKLKTQNKKVEELSNTPTAKLTDFDKIMRSRKLHTDTMDITANVLGNLGHREEKIRGKRDKPVSSNWAKLQDAVLKREFLSFKDIPLSKDMNE